MKIAYLGGSFDPVHVGHLALARACLVTADLDRVVFIVAGHPPHKLDRVLAPASHRVEMVRRAVAREDAFSVDDRETRRHGPCYTIDTVRELHSEHEDDNLFWIIGADTLPELPTWRDANDLLDLIGILSATRPGFDVDAALAGLEASVGPDRVRRLASGFVEMAPVAVSSTEIRRRVRAGESVEDLVPPPVADYITAHGLYA